MYQSLNNALGQFPTKPTIQTANPTYQNHVIQPPEKNLVRGRIPKRLVIDSRDRNCKKYPNSNSYVYELEREYRDVISIQLVQACIPYTGYIINSNNNQLQFQEQLGQSIIVDVPIGDYNNPADLATALETAMNSSAATSTYSVTIDNDTRTFTIMSDLAGDNLFRLMFNDCQCLDTIEDCDSCQICQQRNCNKYISGSIGPKLGFNKVNLLYAQGTILDIIQIDPITVQINGCNTRFETDFTNTAGNPENVRFENLVDALFNVLSVNSDNEMIITGNAADISDLIDQGDGSRILANKFTGTFVWDLEDEKYVILEVNGDNENIADRLDSNNKSIDDGFSVIFFTSEHGENTFVQDGTLPRENETKYYNPPENKIDRIRIRFLTGNGNLYDFNGRDHVLDFQIYMLNQPGKYNVLQTT